MGRALWQPFSIGGLFLGALFLAASLTPSLLPRNFLMQGVVTGFSLAAGYGIGVFGCWLSGGSAATPYRSRSDTRFARSTGSRGPAQPAELSAGLTRRSRREGLAQSRRLGTYREHACGSEALWTGGARHRSGPTTMRLRSASRYWCRSAASRTCSSMRR